MANPSQIPDTPPDAPADGLVFLSYSTDDKILAGNLKSELMAFGFDVFLAHEDLVPSEEWQREILTALRRCEVFTAVLTQNFRKSDWTDQEAGFALSRVPNCVILSMMVPPVTSPHAFLGPYQALRLDPRRSHQTCIQFVKVISERLGVSEARKERAIQEFGASRSFAAARTNAKALLTFDRFSREQMDKILTAALTNDQVRSAFKVRENLGTLVSRNEASPGLRERFLQVYS